MPCTYTGSLEGDRELALKEANTQAVSSLTKVTAMLCESCKKLEDRGLLSVLSQRTQDWWKKHKKVDQDRKAKR